MLKNDKKLKGLRELIKDKVYGIWREEDGYVVQMWHIDKKSYKIGIRDKNLIEVIDYITQEGKELNECIVGYFNFIIFEYLISDDYNFFSY